MSLLIPNCYWEEAASVICSCQRHQVKGAHVLTHGGAQKAGEGQSCLGAGALCLMHEDRLPSHIAHPPRAACSVHCHPSHRKVPNPNPSLYWYTNMPLSLQGIPWKSYVLHTGTGTPHLHAHLSQDLPLLPAFLTAFGPNSSQPSSSCKCTSSSAQITPILCNTQLRAGRRAADPKVTKRCHVTPRWGWTTGIEARGTSQQLSISGEHQYARHWLLLPGPVRLEEGRVIHDGGQQS